MREPGKGRKRQPYPFPEPSPSDWLQQLEPFDLHWVRYALQAGNAPVLARYLRETKEVDPSLLESLARMLQPKTAGQQRLRLEFRYRGRGRPAKARPCLPLPPAELADLLDPPPGSGGWRLRFVRPKGSPGKPNQYWSQYGIYMKVRFALAQQGKLYLAVEEVQRETGLSRPTIYRAWRANKPQASDWLKLLSF